MLCISGRQNENKKVNKLTIFYRYTLTMTMGLRGRDEHKSLLKGDLRIVDGPDGEEIVFTERVTKTRATEGRKSASRYFCTCSDNPNFCLIELVKKFTEKKPMSAREDSHPFYLTPVPVKYIKPEGYWYRETQLGKNKIGAFLPDACSLASIGRHTNHGARRTAVKRMRNAGIPDDRIIKITGHSSVQTLAVYDDELEHDQHVQIQNIITRKEEAKVVEKIVEEPKSDPGQLDQIFRGAVFNSCTINISLGPTYSASQNVEKAVMPQQFVIPQKLHPNFLVEYSDSE